VLGTGFWYLEPNFKKMNKYLIATLLILMVTLNSCELIGDIFQAGFYTAIIVIIIVVVLIVWIFRKFRR
jgi:hypothetical protein